MGRPTDSGDRVCVRCGRANEASNRRCVDCGFDLSSDLQRDYDLYRAQAGGPPAAVPGEPRRRDGGGPVSTKEPTARHRPPRKRRQTNPNLHRALKKASFESGSAGVTESNPTPDHAAPPEATMDLGAAILKKVIDPQRAYPETLPLGSAAAMVAEHLGARDLGEAAPPSGPPKPRAPRTRPVTSGRLRPPAPPRPEGKRRIPTTNPTLRTQTRNRMRAVQLPSVARPEASAPVVAETRAFEQSAHSTVDLRAAEIQASHTPVPPTAARTEVMARPATGPAGPEVGSPELSPQPRSHNVSLESTQAWTSDALATVDPAGEVPRSQTLAWGIPAAAAAPVSEEAAADRGPTTRAWGAQAEDEPGLEDTIVALSEAPLTHRTEMVHAGDLVGPPTPAPEPRHDTAVDALPLEAMAAAALADDIDWPQPEDAEPDPLEGLGQGLAADADDDRAAALDEPIDFLAAPDAESEPTLAVEDVPEVLSQAPDVQPDAFEVDQGSEDDAAVVEAPDTVRRAHALEHEATFEDDREVARSREEHAPGTGPLAHNIKHGTTTYVDATRRGFRKGKAARIPWARVFFTGLGLGLIILGVVIIVARQG